MEEPNTQISRKVTTIKLSLDTKDRLDNLKTHHRDTYEDILQNILLTLNLCKANPEAAQRKLLAIDRQKRKDAFAKRIKQIKQKQNPQNQVNNFRRQINGKN